MTEHTAIKAFARQLASFTGAGLVGLGVDAGLFMLLTSQYGEKIAVARAVSATCAIVATWLLNRRLTFPEQRSRRRGVELARYALVQGVGLVVNMGVFAAALRLIPPLAALIAGAAAAFAFNFVAIRKLVYPSAAKAR